MRSYLLPASIVVSFLAGSSAPTPLYAVYQAQWALSPLSITLVFGLYAIAVLATLLIFGSLSDHVGRRPVLFVTALLQTAAMVVFLLADGLSTLIAARVVQGLATGAAASAAGAAMIDLDRDRGTVVNGFAPMLGTGTGSIVAGLFIQYLPAPTKLVFVVLGVVFLLQAAAVLVMPETVTRKPGALAALRPRIHVPPRMRAAVLLTIPALVGAWALAGFYGSLGPTLVRKLAGSQSPVLGGAALFVLALSGVASVLLSRARAARATVAFGSAALAAGVFTTLGALALGSIPLFFLGTVIAGAGFGASFHGSIRSVLATARAEERAGVLSVLYIVSYLSMGLPAILAGLRVVHGSGIVGTAYEYGAGVILMALVALFGTRLGEPASGPIPVPEP